MTTERETLEEFERWREEKALAKPDLSVMAFLGEKAATRDALAIVEIHRMVTQAVPPDDLYPFLRRIAQLSDIEQKEIAV